MNLTRLILILGGFFLPLAAAAVGVAVNPARLEVFGRSGQERVETILVSNPARDVAIFEIYPDEFEAMIRIAPASFVLESGDQKKVTIKIAGTAAGRFETLVSVIARPLSESAFNAASGIKIPLSIEVAPTEKSLALALTTLPTSGRMLGVFGYALMWAVYALFLRSAIKYFKKSKI